MITDNRIRIKRRYTISNPNTMDCVYNDELLDSHSFMTSVDLNIKRYRRLISVYTLQLSCFHSFKLKVTIPF